MTSHTEIHANIKAVVPTEFKLKAKSLGRVSSDYVEAHIW